MNELNLRKTRLLEATLDDAAALAPRLRQADIDELKAATGENPHEALYSGVGSAVRAWTLFAGDAPIAIGGVSRHNLGAEYRDVGIAWMLAAPEIKKYGGDFLRSSAWCVAAMLQKYRHLTNFVDTRNLGSIRWLTWLGFKAQGVISEYGVEKRPFVGMWLAEKDFRRHV